MRARTETLLENDILHFQVILSRYAKRAVKSDKTANRRHTVRRCWAIMPFINGYTDQFCPFIAIYPFQERTILNPILQMDFKVEMAVWRS